MTKTMAYAMVMLSGVTALAQRPPEVSSEAMRITVTGCVQRESDYRRIAGGVNRSGPLRGTNGEFVLINAGTSVVDARRSRSIGDWDVSQTPSAMAGAAFELTGTRESDAAMFLGRWVEVTGVLEASPLFDDLFVGRRTSVVQASDLNVSRIELQAVRSLNGSCAAQ